MRVGIVGTGRAGGALARGIAGRRGSARLAGIHSRSLRRARSLVRSCGRGHAFASLEEMVRRSDVILLAVPDGAIGSVAKALAGACKLKGRSVLHLSGALGGSVLDPVRREGGAAGGIHPLLAFPPAGRPTPIPPGSWFAVGGDARAEASARRIARHLRGRVILIADAARPAWHLAAVLVANHSTALAAIAVEILARRGGISGPRIRSALASLLRSAADGVESLGPELALSGPAARGDAVTVQKHLALLASEPAVAGRIYRALSSVAVDIARARGDLDAATARRLRKALGARR